MTDKERPSSPFEAFDAKLRQARGEPPVEDGPRGGLSLGTGMHIGIEILAGLVGGGLIGYGLDHWLETSPFLFILLLVLGTAAGFRNAFRALDRATRERGSGDDKA